MGIVWVPLTIFGGPMSLGVPGITLDFVAAGFNHDAGESTVMMLAIFWFRVSCCLVSAVGNLLSVLMGEYVSFFFKIILSKRILPEIYCRLLGLPLIPDINCPFFW